MLLGRNYAGSLLLSSIATSFVKDQMMHSTKDQEDIMFKHYFSTNVTDDTLSHVDLFLKGQGPFEFMFDKYSDDQPNI